MCTQYVTVRGETNGRYWRDWNQPSSPLEAFQYLPAASTPLFQAEPQRTTSTTSPATTASLAPMTSLPDELGHFGRYGGKFVPEALQAALLELQQAFADAQADPSFGAVSYTHLTLPTNREV